MIVPASSQATCRTQSRAARSRCRPRPRRRGCRTGRSASAPRSRGRRRAAHAVGGGEVGPRRATRAGVPATWNTPGLGVEHDVVDWRPRAAAPPAGGPRRSTSWWRPRSPCPPSCTERDPTVSPPLRISSVSPCSTSMRSIGTPVRSDDDHRPCRDVALPVGGRAGAHQQAAVGLELDRAVLRPADAGGDLDVGGDADAELQRVARCPAGRLLGAQLVVAGGLERPLERRGVVADVVRPCRRRWCRPRGTSGSCCGGAPRPGRSPISAANRSTMRSIATAASGRPAPR